MKRLLDFGALYASKVGAILVGFLVLPEFNRLLGAAEFGLVAMLTSIQAMLMLFDFGTSALVSRTVADAKASAESKARTLGACRWLLVAVCVPALVFGGWIGLQSGSSFSLADVVLGWLAVTLSATQNLDIVALLSARQYRRAAILQVCATGGKALVTLLILRTVKADFSTYVMAQVACAALIAGVSRQISLSTLGTTSAPQSPATIIEVLRRSKSFMFYGLAGAAVLQLDKIIVGTMASPQELSHYFLATSLCMMPISILASPISQYFQPQIIRTYTAGDFRGFHRHLRHFIVTMLLVLVPFCAGLWYFLDPVVTFWLHGVHGSDEVALFATILLPGATIGAFGYIPLAILLSNNEMTFLSTTSIFTATVTLAACAWQTATGPVTGVCMIYAFYHGLSTLISGIKAGLVVSRTSAA